MLRFRFFGIPFEVSPSFWVISALLGGGIATGADAVTLLLVWVACVFVSIVVHELGHALAARHYGAEPIVELRDLGGVTRIFGRVLSRAEGFWVTLAGPAAGFALYLVVRAVIAWAYPHGLTRGAAGGGTGAFVTVKALDFLVWINLVWTLFNLLPILPLDGGQLLRALLGPRRLNLTQAVGVFFAGSLATYEALQGQWFTAIFLGYLAFVNFRGNPRPLPGGITR